MLRHGVVGRQWQIRNVPQFTLPFILLFNVLMPKKHRILKFRYGWAIFDYQDFYLESSFCLSPFTAMFFPAVRRYLTSHRAKPFVYEGDEEGICFKIVLTPGECYAYRYDGTTKEGKELLASEWRYPCDDLAVLAQLLDDVDFYQRDLAREDRISACLYEATAQVARKEERRARCRYIAAEVAALRQLLQLERTALAAEGESAFKR